MLSWILSLHCMSSSPSQSLLSRIRKPHLLFAFCGLAVYQILAPFLPSFLLSNSSKQFCFFCFNKSIKKPSLTKQLCFIFGCSRCTQIIRWCEDYLPGERAFLFFFSFLPPGWKPTHMGLARGDPVSPLCPLKLSSNSFHYHF